MRSWMAVIFIALILGCTSNKKKKMVDMTLDSLFQLDAREIVHTFSRNAILTGGNDFFILFPNSQQEIRVGWDPSTDVITSLRVDINTMGMKPQIDTLPAHWMTNSGLYLGAKLEDVQKINGQPFNLMNNQNGIVASDWNKGSLSSETAEVIFSAIESPGTAIPTPITSDEVINRQWRFQVSSITLRRPVEVSNYEDNESSAYTYPEYDEFSEEEIVAARQEFRNAIRDVGRVSLPYDFVNIMESGGKEVKCYGFPTGGFCNREPRSDINNLYGMLEDTTKFYALFWSGNRFAYYADIPKLFITTFDKNWKPISTADLHIWLGSWQFEQGECAESEPQYLAILNADLSFLLTYSAGFSCAGDKEPSSAQARIYGQINSDGTITVNREGIN